MDFLSNIVNTKASVFDLMLDGIFAGVMLYTFVVLRQSRIPAHSLRNEGMKISAHVKRRREMSNAVTDDTGTCGDEYKKKMSRVMSKDSQQFAKISAYVNRLHQRSDALSAPMQ